MRRGNCKVILHLGIDKKAEVVREIAQENSFSKGTCSRGCCYS